MLQNNQQLQIKDTNNRVKNTRSDAQILDLSKVLSLTEWRQFLAETIILLGFLIIVDLLWLDGTGNAAINPTPLWIPVILISTQYGLMGGVIAALLTSTVFYTFTVPAQWADQDFYQYTKLLFGQPALWLLSALILGGLRSLQQQKMAQLELQLDKTKKMSSKFGHSLEDAIKDNTHLEQLIAGEIVTVSAVLSSFSQLDMTDNGSIINSFSPLFRDGIGATDFTLFSINHQTAAPVICFRRGEKITITDGQPLNEKLIERLNITRSPLHFEDIDFKDLLPEPTLLAVPISNGDDGELQGIVLVQKLHSGLSATIVKHRSLLLGKALCSLLATHSLNVSSSVLDEINDEYSRYKTS